jgi:DNA repair protein RecO (recombination protein O)
MDERASGIILRTRPLTETSLIVQWLTPNLGRLATVAKGARRPKSPFRGKLDLFYVCDFSFARSRRSELHTLREVSLRETHRGLRQDLGRLQQAAYCAALIEQATETETPLPVPFALLDGLARQLSGSSATPQNILAFEAKLLHELGLSPHPAASRLSEGSRRMLERLMDTDWPALERLKLSPAQVGELSHFLHGFLAYHLERVPAGRPGAIHPALA